MTESLWSRLDPATAWGARTDAELAREQRELTLFGLGFELYWIPERGAREGIPSSVRPAFAPNRGLEIRRKEAIWSDEGVVATPNRFPFYWPQVLLWPATGSPREVDEVFLRRSLEVAAGARGTLLVNTVGASASIPLVHAHLVAPRPRLPGEMPLEVVAEADEVRCLATRAESEVPFLVVVIEAAAAAVRAAWTRRLLDARNVAAYNLLACDDRVWILPRRRETPTVGFPFAIGAGELSGRFVFSDEARYRGAVPEELEEALREATVPLREEELAALRRMFA